MKQLMKTTTMLVLALWQLSANAQSSTKITVFKQDDKKGATTTDSDTPESSYKHNIKWNYCLVARGVFLLNYEFLLAPKITGEVGAGLTYRDVFFEIFKLEGLDGSQYSFIDNEASPQVSFAVEGGIRFYPQDHTDFEGFYLSPMLSYRKYDFSSDNATYYNYSTSTSTDLSAYKQNYSLFDIQLKFGYQYEGFVFSEVLSDFYAGFSYRMANVNYIQTTEINNPNTGNVTVSHSQGNKKLNFPSPLLGLKIAIPF